MSSYPTAVPTKLYQQDQTDDLKAHFKSYPALGSRPPEQTNADQVGDDFPNTRPQQESVPATQPIDDAVAKLREFMAQKPAFQAPEPAQPEPNPEVEQLRQFMDSKPAFGSEPSETEQLPQTTPLTPPEPEIRLNPALQKAPTAETADVLSNAKANAGFRPEPIPYRVNPEDHAVQQQKLKADVRAGMMKPAEAVGNALSLGVENVAKPFLGAEMTPAIRSAMGETETAIGDSDKPLPGESLLEWQQRMKRRWEETPEPIPGFKGVLEQGADPLAYLTVGPAEIVRGAKALGRLGKGAAEVAKVAEEVPGFARVGQLAMNEPGVPLELGGEAGRLKAVKDLAQNGVQNGVQNTGQQAQGQGVPNNAAFTTPEKLNLEADLWEAKAKGATPQEIEAIRAQYTEVPAGQQGGSIWDRARQLATNETGSIGLPGKQPWEMTKVEYQQTLAGQRVERVPKGYYNREGQIQTNHRSAVDSALQSGNPVPDSVLAEYPDLARKYRRSIEPTEPSFPAKRPTLAEMQAEKAVVESVPMGTGARTPTLAEAEALQPPTPAVERQAPMTPNRRPLWEGQTDVTPTGTGRPTAEITPYAETPSGTPPKLPSGRQPGGPKEPLPFDPIQTNKRFIADAIGPDTPEFWTRVDNLVKATTTNFYDRIFPLYKLDKGSGLAVYNQAKVVPGSTAYGEAVLQRDFMPILKPVGNDVKYLEQYMVLQRMRNILAKNPHASLPSGPLGRKITGASDIEREEVLLLREIGDKRMKAITTAVYGDKATGAKGLYDLNDEWILQQLEDAGMLTSKGHVQILGNNRHYIDFHRDDFDSVGGHFETALRPEASVSSNNLQKMELSGSDRQLNQPLARTLAQVVKVQNLIARNKAANAMVDALTVMSEGLPEGQKLIKIVKAGDGGVEQSKVLNTIAFFKDGERYIAEVPAEYAAVAKNLDGETANSTLRFMATLSAPLRHGAVTYNPAFVLVNPIRDAWSALYREGLTPFGKDWVTGLVAAITKNDLYYDAAKAGALSGTIADSMRTTDTLARAVRQMQLGHFSLKSPRDVIAFIPRTIESMNLAGERATRIGTFNKLQNQGIDQLTAAVRSRDVTVDFSKSGNIGRQINMIVPFLNAGIQGGANTVRLLKSNPKQAMIGASILGTGVVGTWLWNQRFETFKDIPDYVMRDNFVIMWGEGEKKADPKQPGAKPERFPLYVTIPKGPTGVAITAPVEMLLRVAWRNNDRSVVENFLQGGGDVARSLSPIEPSVSGLIPPILSTPASVGFNKDFFTGRDIVPAKEQKMISEDQYGPESSSVAVALGQQYHVSPRLIDFAIRDFTGGTGTTAAWLADLGLGALGYNPEPRGASKLQGLSEAEQMAKTPVLKRFIGVRNTQQESLGWDQFNKAVEDTRREFAQLPEPRRLGLNMGEVNDAVFKALLEPAERADYQRLTWEIMKPLLLEATSDPDYKQAPDNQKASYLQKVMSAARQRAETMFANQLGEDVIVDRRGELATSSPATPTPSPTTQSYNDQYRIKIGGR